MDFAKLFEPDTVAVVGISRSNPFHPANVIYHKNKLRYRPDTYAVSPKGGTLFGEEVYTDIRAVPKPVDLAVLVIRADHVPDTIRTCVQAGVGSAIVISGGFAESGREDLQTEIAGLATEHEFPVIGPNCLGVYSPPHVDAFFLPYERLLEPRRGNVSLISQSGGILVDLMIKLTQEGVGLARSISVGNKAAVDEVDLLAFLEDDPATRVIGIYLEGFGPGRGRAFVDRVKSMHKPVVVQKAGRTPGGTRAVSSHTAAIAGDYRVFSEVMAQAGVTEAHSETAFVATCEAYSCCDQRGVGRVCIVTASGGHGAIASDGCVQAGLQLAEVPEDDRRALQDQLSNNIRAIASLRNPVDLTGSAGDADFLAATRFFLERDYTDCVLLLLLPYLPAVTTDVGARVAQVAREIGKPVVTYLPHVDRYSIFIDGFEANGVPVAHSVEGAVHMARALMPEGAQ